MCLGPGGVGKTTLAAALGIAAALDGKRVVVLTIDPARRLADTLGLARQLGNEPKLVAGPWPGQLWAAMLDPTETFESLIRTHGRPEQAQRLAANPLFATILRSLSGTSEYMAAERLNQLHADARFDRVIVDTPPSRHAIDFLDGPIRLANFVDHRLYRSVLGPGRTVLRSVSVGSQIVARLATRLVGTNLVTDVIDLFADLEGLDEGFRQRAMETRSMLLGPDCGYVLVTSGRYEPIREAHWISDELAKRSQQLDSLVVNRLTPFAPLPSPTAAASPAAEPGSHREPLEENLAQLRSLAALEEQLVGGLVDTLDAGATPIRIDERDRPPRTLVDLLALANELRSQLAHGEPGGSR
jgi:anion-transporting  ArsA/GET3 family ATPase